MSAKSFVNAMATGQVFDLEHPRANDSPVHPNHVPPGYGYVLHRRHESDAVGGVRTSAAGTLFMSEHSGTHIDALCHQAIDLTMFGGEPVNGCQTPFGFDKLGVETVEPLVGRGVLIDLVRYYGEPVSPGRWVRVGEVRAAAAAQGVTPQPGDVVLVRTGAGAFWSDPTMYFRASGFDGATSRWLADAGVMAVGSDNFAWDFHGALDPDYGVRLPGHRILLVESGVYILENMYLEGLGEANVTEFAFVCVPLKIVGATGSPVRPIAIVTDAEMSLDEASCSDAP